SEALHKFDQILNITPDDMDTLAVKASVAQAEGDLPRASVLLASLHPPPDDSNVLYAQVYQAILLRRPAQIIPQLKEILAKPDPAWGYATGEMRLWLGWAQGIADDPAGTVRLLLHCPGSIQRSIRCAMIGVSRDSAPRPRRSKPVEAAVSAAVIPFAGDTAADTITPLPAHPCSTSLSILYFNPIN